MSALDSGTDAPCGVQTKRSGGHFKLGVEWCAHPGCKKAYTYPQGHTEDGNGQPGRTPAC
eukprot:3606018-Prorocentrum_lima.AAC.1